MLQKIKKGGVVLLILFLFSLFLFILYKNVPSIIRAYSKSILGYSVNIGEIEVKPPGRVILRNIKSSYLNADSMCISFSLKGIVGGKVYRITLYHPVIFVDALRNAHKNKKRGRAGLARKVHYPFFVLSTYTVNNCEFVGGDFQLNIKKIQGNLRMKMQELYASVSISSVSFDTFFVDTVYFELNQIKSRYFVQNGYFLSNIGYISHFYVKYDDMIKIKTDYGQILGAGFDKVAFTYNIGKDKFSLSIKNAVYKDRNLDNLIVRGSIKKDTAHIKRIMVHSDWLNADASGNVNGFENPRKMRFDFNVNSLFIDEKLFGFTGHMQFSGTPGHFHGMGYFKDLRLKSFVADSFFGNLYVNNNRLSIVGGHLFKGKSMSVFDAGLGYHMANFKGAVKLYVNEVAKNAGGIVFLKGMFSYIDGSMFASMQGDMNDFRYGTSFSVKRGGLNVFSVSPGLIFFNINGNNVSVGKQGPMNLLLKGLLSGTKSANFKTELVSGDGDSLNLICKVYREQEIFSMIVDSVWGKFRRTTVNTRSQIVIRKKGSMETFTSGDLLFGNGHVSIQGEHNDISGVTNITASIRAFPLWIINGEGTANGLFSFSGTVENPDFSADLDFSDLRIENYLIDKFQVTASYGNNFLDIEKLNIYYKNGLFTMKGNMKNIVKSLKPFSFNIDSTTCNLYAKSDGLNISDFNDLSSKIFTSDRAFLSFDLHMQGFLRNPYITGNLSIKGNNGVFQPVSMYLDTFSLFGNFVGNEFIVKSMEGKSKNGVMIGKGSIKSTNSLFDNPSVVLGVQNIEVSPSPEIQAVVNGDLSVSKGRDVPLAVTGNLKLQKAYIFAEFSQPSSPNEAYAGIPFVEMDINMSASDNIYLVNELAQIEFGGRLEYIRNKSGYIYNGSFDVKRGNIVYLDHIFDMRGGDIVFNNTSYINPELNMQAVTRVDSYDIELDLSGTLNEPKISFMSHPSLDESDIISLLSFGTLLADAPVSAGDINLLKKRALNIAQGLLSNKIRRKLGLRELEVSYGSLSEDPHLSLGFYISRNLYLKYFHDFQSMHLDQFELRYKLSRHLGLYGSRDENGEYSLGVGLEMRF